MKKRVLITGGAGYIGTNCVDLLLKSGYDVTVYDVLLYTDAYLKDVKFVHGDVRDYNRLGAIINDFDYVIWLAALVGEAACNVNEKLTRQINYESVKWLVNHYNGKILFPSTASVYGRNNKLLTEETEEINPISLYAETKYQAEQLVLNEAENSFVFRLGTLGGYGSDSGQYGGPGYGRFRNDLVLNVWSIQAAQDLPLTVMGKDQWRPLLNVLEIARCVLFAIENNISGLYNFVDENLTLGELAQRVIEVSGSKSELIFSDLPFSDMRNYMIDGSKFRNTGWEPQYSLNDAIKSIFSLIKEGRILDLKNPLFNNGERVRQLGWFGDFE